MKNDDLIARELPLSAAERRSLQRLVGMLIPASAEYAVPGADDAQIFADILATLRPDARLVSEALRLLDELAGGAFGELDAAAGQQAAERFGALPSPLAALLVNTVVQCYYRDDRVMTSLEMEARPPFPKGFELEQGDWSLLDPVRARGKLYRDAP